MKWIILIGAVLIMGGCCTRVIAPMPVPGAAVIEPVMVYPYSQGPIDVTTTTIDYY